MNPTRTTPPRYNNTTLGNRLYAQSKGPNVTNTIQHRAVLIIFLLNLQTITITRMLSTYGAEYEQLLVSFSASTVGLVTYLECKIVPEMTCSVLSGTLSLYISITTVPPQRV